MASPYLDPLKKRIKQIKHNYRISNIDLDRSMSIAHGPLIVREDRLVCNASAHIALQSPKTGEVGQR